MNCAPLSQNIAIGVSGLARATPHFSSAALEVIHHGPGSWSPRSDSPRIVPAHWFYGLDGWAAMYFYDSVSRNPKMCEPGRFRCQVRHTLHHESMCDHEISEEDCCKGTWCWRSSSTAPSKMAQHLQEVHGLAPPRARPWSSSLFDTEGCLEVFFCAQCQGSRQMMALAGWQDEFHWEWCVFFGVLGARGIPTNVEECLLVRCCPCVAVALLTRHRLIALQRIEESDWTTVAIQLFCAPCSIAQTHRELVAAGVSPGVTCCDSRGKRETSNGSEVKQTQPAPPTVTMMTRT